MHLTRRAFTLIELLVVIAIIAILSVVVVLTLNPAELLRQSRDSNRVSDMSTLNSALGVYSTDQSGAIGFNTGSSSVVYVSIPDPTASTTSGDQCQGLGLITLSSPYSYHCAASSTFRNVNGTGWIPVNFSNISSGSPLGNLPVDPINQSSSRNYYTYTTNGTQFEVTAAMESQKYNLGGSSDVIGPDGATLSTVYAKGTNLALEPLDYGDVSLVGLWNFSEGSSSIAYDYSGSNATGSWNGTATGTNGYYSAGKIGAWAGAFDGASTFVNMGSPTSLNLTSALTVSAWINTSNPTAFFPNIFSNSSNNTNGYTLELYSSTGKIDLNLAGVHVVQGGTVLQPNTWYFVTGTWNGSTAAVYLNGSLDGSVATTSSLTYTSAASYIGAVRLNPGTAHLWLPGLIDDVRIYNRALTAAQIAAMYNGAK